MSTPDYPQIDQGPFELRWQDYDADLRAAAVTTDGKHAVVIEDDGRRTLVTGFRTADQAHAFLTFGDLDEDDNDWPLFYPSVTLRWTRL